MLPVALVMLTEAQAATATGQAVDGTNVQQLQCMQKQSQGKKSIAQHCRCFQHFCLTLSELKNLFANDNFAMVKPRSLHPKV